jgi:hypothetical protein
MKIAVITPHQDKKRSKFLNRLEHYISRQTRKPDSWIIVDDHTGMAKDLTLRIKVGIDRALESGCSGVLIMEDDDWYHSTYIETMLSNWEQAGKPDLYGQGYTDYYHIKVQKHTRLVHPGRASLMSTFIHLPAIYNFTFPANNYIFLDINLWKQLKGKTFTPAKPICVGIKHGIGITGGKGHDQDWKLYNKDQDFSILRGLIGKDCDFYEQYFL